MHSFSIFFGMVSGVQIAVIVVVALLFFGGKKIPVLMKGIGGGIKEFKNAAKEEVPEEKTEEKIEEKK